MILRLLLILLLTLPARAGEMVHVELDSAVLARRWPVSAYLPDGHRDGHGRYPMLFFLPGQGATTSDLLRKDLGAIADATIAAGRMPPAVIVVPELRRSWGVDRTEHMETAITQDLLPQATARWRGYGTRAGQAIGGISAGGYAALRLALQHPDRFAALALLSPAIYVPLPPAASSARQAGVFGSPDFDPAVWTAMNYPALLPRFRETGISLPLFIASGNADHLGIAEQSQRLFRTWRGMRMPAELVMIPGGHEDAVWRALLPRAMEFAFRLTLPPER